MKICIYLAALALAGCATGPSEYDIRRAERQAEFNRTIPVCEGESDCKSKWEAAQIWIVKNAGFKLQIATDVLLETYNSTGSSVYLAARVLKEPLGDGRYRIVPNVWCDNIFGCRPGRMKALLDFNYTAGSAAP